MALTAHEQFSQLLSGAKRVLITFGSNGRHDAIAGSIALANFLEAQGKQVDVISPGFVLPQNLSFLEKAHTIAPKFNHLQQFILTVDVHNAGVKELQYDVEDEKLRIFITPEEGFLTKDRVRTAQSSFVYDAIITLDTPDLDSLGELYTKHAELFHKTPIINIDHATANEHFGHVNMVDVTAASTCELLFELMKQTGETYITESMSTALLTGMIAKTRSFKAENIKPHTLSIAGELMKLGADRDFIVENLYHTRSIATLKLWGQALTNLQHDKQHGIVWTTITRDDFARSEATEADLYEIIDELITSSPEARVTVLLHEHDDGEDKYVHVMLHATKGYHAKELLQPFLPEGNATRAQARIKEKTLKDVELDVIQTLKEILEQR